MTLLEQTPAIFIEDIVRTPDGRIGTVVSQCFLFPENGIEGCMVDVLGIGCIAYNTADLEIVTLEQVEQELQAVPSYCEQQAVAFAAERY